MKLLPLYMSLSDPGLRLHASALDAHFYVH